MNGTSALPPEADIASPPRHVRKVPNPEVADTIRAKKKSPEGGSLNSNLMIVDQAAINAGFAYATTSPLIVPDDIHSTEKAPDYAGALSYWREKVWISTLRLPDRRPNGS